jgi:hypothetical protein
LNLWSSDRILSFIPILFFFLFFFSLFSLTIQNCWTCGLNPFITPTRKNQRFQIALATPGNYTSYTIVGGCQKRRGTPTSNVQYFLPVGAGEFSDQPHAFATVGVEQPCTNGAYCVKVYIADAVTKAWYNISQITQAEVGANDPLKLGEE